MCTSYTSTLIGRSLDWLPFTTRTAMMSLPQCVGIRGTKSANDCARRTPQDHPHSLYFRELMGHKAFLSAFAPFLLQEELADVVLIVERKRIPAHKIVLAARSPFFRALVSSTWLQQPSSGMSVRMRASSWSCCFKSRIFVCVRYQMCTRAFGDAYRVPQLREARLCDARGHIRL